MANDGLAYVKGFLAEPDHAFRDARKQIKFQQRTFTMYGKTIKVPRREAWFGPKPYTFSGHTFPAQKMPPVVAALSIRIEHFLRIQGWRCDVGCMANLYRNGCDSVSWHSDDDHGIDRPVVIASVSLGATRCIRFRRKIPSPALSSALLPNTKNIDLAHGSLLLMGAGVQDTWEHSIPKRKDIGPRINLTFRGTNS